MNILQRKMFANGDVAKTKQSILPLYEKHAKQLSDSKQGIKNEYGGSGVIVDKQQRTRSLGRALSAGGALLRIARYHHGNGRPAH